MCAPAEGNRSLDQPFEAWAIPEFEVGCERSQTTQRLGPANSETEPRLTK